MARRLKLAARAQRDVGEIWRFSAQRWGSERADRYLATLVAAMHDAEADPEHGTTVAHVTGYRIVRSQRHRIAYRFDNRTITVVRVLHMSMDERRHLP